MQMLIRLIPPCRQALREDAVIFDLKWKRNGKSGVRNGVWQGPSVGSSGKDLFRTGKGVTGNILAQTA